MAVTAYIVLDIRRAKKDGTFPLNLRIVKDRKPINIPLGYSLLEKDWDEKKEQVKKSCKHITNKTRFNNLLQAEKAKAYNILTDLDNSGQLDKLNPAELKKRLQDKKDDVFFFTFTEKIIAELQGAKKFGNANAYKNTLGVMKKYKDEKDFSFPELDYNFLKRFENYYLALGNSTNGLSFNMRTIRAIFNRAIKEGVAKKDWYPFDDYKIKNNKTRKRAIKKEVIQEIENLEVEENSSLWHAKNYFLLSFYLRGISFVDMAQIQVKDIVEGRIEYDRQKTGKSLKSIKLTAKAQTILNFYLLRKKKSEYVLPIIKRVGNPEHEYRDIRNALKLYNKDLKQIAELAGIKTTLTSYVSRHSWATAAKNLNVPVEVISESLGHEDLKTTMVYLDSFENDVLDAANELVTG